MSTATAVLICALLTFCASLVIRQLDREAVTKMATDSGSADQSRRSSESEYRKISISVDDGASNDCGGLVGSKAGDSERSIPHTQRGRYEAHDPPSQKAAASKEYLWIGRHQPSRSKTGFLDLPGELRNQIYECANAHPWRVDLATEGRHGLSSMNQVHPQVASE